MISLRNWRIARSGPGLAVFFDPAIERVEIHPLDSEDKQRYLDSRGSVSALDEDEDNYVQKELPLS